LADPIDRFFDKVLVMAPDAAVRGNRFALLRAVTNSFLRVADLGKLAG
jgi:glycyl-tRNA synthetase beta chain